MKTKFIKDLTKGESLQGIILAVKQSNSRKTAKGADYKDLILYDKTGEINAKIWNNSLNNCPDINNGDIISINGTVETYKDKLQINIESLDLLDSEKTKLSDFVKTYDGDLNLLYSNIDRYIKTIKNPWLKKLIQAFFGDKKLKEKFKISPAAQYLHHGYLGGLMKHLSEMLEISEKVCELYPTINRELLIVGVLLHDIGKIEELDTSATINRTRTGKLVPHIPISSNLTYNAITKIDKFPDELRDQIIHMILAHHGQLEFGSPVKPMTLEAMALHLIDQLSSKITIITDRITDQNKPGSFTERISSLETEIYIPLSTEEENLQNNDATLF